MSLSVKTYQENRAKFPITELQEHTGKWAAFSPDGTRIIASAEDIEKLTAEVENAGVDPQEVVFERIELDTDEVFLGAAELL